MFINLHVNLEGRHKKKETKEVSKMSKIEKQGNFARKYTNKIDVDLTS